MKKWRAHNEAAAKYFGEFALLNVLKEQRKAG
jgi:hypothetical protein